MSHDKRGSERGALADVLSTLAAADVAPTWSESAGWQKLEHRLAAAKNSRIPLRSYVLLTAAASIVCCILFLRARILTDITWSTASLIPTNRAKALVPAAPDIAATVAIVTRREVRATHPIFRVRNLSAQTVQALSPKDTFLPQTLMTASREPVQNEPVQARIQRRPAIVYTLNEIMADLPEREAPPKRYSGIFHQKAQPADVPERGNFRRRSAAMPEDEAPVFPHLLN